jgi:hypothetical protein
MRVNVAPEQILLPGKPQLGDRQQVNHAGSHSFVAENIERKIVRKSLNAAFLFRDDDSRKKTFGFRLRSVTVMSRLGLWVRLIDHRAVSRFELSGRDNWASRLVGLFQGPPQPADDDVGIRPFRGTDLPECLRLANGVSDAADFGLIWDERSLSRQLSFHSLAHRQRPSEEYKSRADGHLAFSVSAALFEVQP